MKSHKKGIIKKALPKRLLNRLRRGLSKEAKSELIVQSGLSSSTVEKVLLGLRNNEQIVQLALDLSHISVEHKKEIIERINNGKNEPCR